MSEHTGQPPVIDLVSPIDLVTPTDPSIVEIDSTASPFNSMPQSAVDVPQDFPGFSRDSQGPQVEKECLGYGTDCVWPDVERTGRDLCALCKKVAITVLEKSYGETAEGAAIVELVRVERMQNFQAARGKGVLVCALQSPSWEDSEWRKEFRPQNPRPCVTINSTGADEGYFCQSCTVHEKFNERDPHFTPASEEDPHVRLNFTCIWRDNDYKEAWWRCSRIFPCNGTSRAAYPASMCEWCHSAVSMEDGYQNPRYWEYFYDDGRLQEAYPGQDVVLRMKGSPFEREVDEKFYRIQGHEM